MPVVLVLLVLIFGGVVAAGMPLIGLLAVLGALTTTRLLAGVTDISAFAVNTITLLGLGMAIDYSLLVVSRFREELRAGHETPQAIARTLAAVLRGGVRPPRRTCAGQSAVGSATAIPQMSVLPKVGGQSVPGAGTGIGVPTTRDCR
jgi:hypothetical protein